MRRMQGFIRATAKSKNKGLRQPKRRRARGLGLRFG
jgi:hypothetical protein